MQHVWVKFDINLHFVDRVHADCRQMCVVFVPWKSASTFLLLLFWTLFLNIFPLSLYTRRRSARTRRFFSLLVMCSWILKFDDQVYTSRSRPDGGDSSCFFGCRLCKNSSIVQRTRKSRRDTVVAPIFHTLWSILSSIPASTEDILQHFPSSRSSHRINLIPFEEKKKQTAWNWKIVCEVVCCTTEHFLDDRRELSYSHFITKNSSTFLRQMRVHAQCDTATTMSAWGWVSATKAEVDNKQFPFSDADQTLNSAATELAAQLAGRSKHATALCEDQIHVLCTIFMLFRSASSRSCSISLKLKFFRSKSKLSPRTLSTTLIPPNTQSRRLGEHVVA